MKRITVKVALSLTLLAATAISCTGQSATDLEKFFRQNAGFTKDQMAAIQRGKAVSVALKSRAPAEVFVLGAVFVNADAGALGGAGGGSIPFDFFKVPPGAQLVTSLNGGTVALMEVVGMASLGRLKIPVDRYPLSAAKKGYDDFQHGLLVGRAVLMPGALKGADDATSATA